MTPGDDGPALPPQVRVSDAERAAAVSRLQTALGEGRLDLDEFGDRAGAAWAATTTGELDLLLADLPAPGGPSPDLVGDGAAGPVSSVFGDVVLTPVTGVPARVGSVFGDVRVDLRGLRTAAGTVHLELSSVFGDVEVVVGEGVPAQLSGRTVFGDRRTDLAAVPQVPGAPRVVVTGRSVFGDLRLRSLPPGVPTSRWRAVLDRLGGRRQLPPSGS